MGRMTTIYSHLVVNKLTVGNRVNIRFLTEVYEQTKECVFSLKGSLQRIDKRVVGTSSFGRAVAGQKVWPT
jgi:hypothetical protein